MDGCASAVVRDRLCWNSCAGTVGVERLTVVLERLCWNGWGGTVNGCAGTVVLAVAAYITTIFVLERRGLVFGAAAGGL